MPLSAHQIRELSRLLDQALDLSDAQRSAWLETLPPDLQPLLPSLRRMLQPGGGRPALSTQPPTLQDLPADDDAGAPGQHVGPYRLLRVIGRGGMGAVWLAERADGIFEREVAVKLPRMASRHRLSERMARERQIGARLEHPHIARLYDAGIDERQRPYLVMEYVPGSDLLEHCELRLLDERQRLQLLLQACTAVAHAHRHLVIHRDIKPSNLLVSLDGTLKLLDFGIATLMDQDDGGGGSTATGDSQRVMTPRYAAPEQVAGAPASTATDIFALGVVAHELLTGAVPPAAADGLRQVDPVLGRDLQAVLQRALQPEPADRYSSVERLADDLQRVLDHRPVAASPGSAWHRALLFGRRHRPQLAAVAAGVLLLAGATTLLVRQQFAEWAEAERSAQARQFVFAVLEDTLPRQGQSAADINGAQIVKGAIDRARQGFVGQPALRGEVLLQLAMLLRRLQPDEQTVQLFQQAHDLLEQHAAAGDAALETARAQLAAELLQTSPTPLDRAARLAGQALSGCRRDTAACAAARAYAHHALKHLARVRGDLQAAIEHGRQNVLEHVTAFGANHAETVMARADLAVVLRNSGHLGDAAEQLAQALDQARRAMLRATDVVDMRIVQAVLHIDLGRHEEAERDLQALLEDEAARPRQVRLWRLLAHAQIERGRVQAAWRSADSAWQIAKSGPGGIEQVFARQVRARAASQLGRHAEARSEMQAVESALAQGGLAPDSVERLRARRFSAEVALRSGDLPQARQLLADLVAAHGSASPGPRSPMDLAQALQLQAALARHDADHGVAQARLEEAARLLATALPESHPLRQRNEIGLALSQALQMGGQPTTRLQQSIARLLSRLPADSAWQDALQLLARNPAAGWTWVV